MSIKAARVSEILAKEVYSFSIPPSTELMLAPFSCYLHSAQDSRVAFPFLRPVNIEGLEESKTILALPPFRFTISEMIL